MSQYTKKFDITAIIYDRKGRVLSIGKNSYVKTHPMMAKFAKKAGQPERVFLHAEVDAIIKCKDLSKAHKISVFRFNRKGLPLNACPCEICKEAIEMTGIRVVTHT